MRKSILCQRAEEREHYQLEEEQELRGAEATPWREISAHHQRRSLFLASCLGVVRTICQHNQFLMTFRIPHGALALPIAMAKRELLAFDCVGVVRINGHFKVGLSEKRDHP